MTNDTYFDDDLLDPYSDEAEKRTTDVAVTYVMLVASLIMAIVWAVYAAHNYNSERIQPGSRGDHEKNISVEEIYEMVSQRFDELGNQATLAEDSFRQEDAHELQDTNENPKGNNRDVSDDESCYDVDLENGSGDANGCVVVNEVAADPLSRERLAPNCCAICLESYAPGEEVVWSSNENCHHLYHKDCISAYFAHAKKKGKHKCLCPTCRQEFLVLEEKESQEKGKTDEENGLNIASAIVEHTFTMRQQRILGRNI